MLITPAVIQDETGIKALLQTCDLPSDDLCTSHLQHFFVIKDAEEIIASVGLEVCDGFGLLRSLALAVPYRGQGLGIQLVAHIQEYAHSKQIRSIYLLTTTADRFFARIGYQTIPRQCAPRQIQETVEFQSLCPDSAICMYKELDFSRRNQHAS